MTDSTLDYALDEYFAPPTSEQWAGARDRLDRALSGVRRAVYYDLIPSTAVGPLWLATSPHGLAWLRFGGTEGEFLARLPKGLRGRAARSSAEVASAAEQVRAYLAGERDSFDLPIDWSTMSEFQRRVLEAAQSVARGRVTTYREIAQRLGRPGASRAVGQALGHNPVPIVLPCHRVLASNGSLGGYIGGLEIKARLLTLEGAIQS